jgi:cytochrome c oxidase subunit IV
MFDISTTRTMALQNHPPKIVYGLLFALGLLCSLLAGYRMANGKRRSWLHILTFIVITVSIVYVMLNVEYPRAGLIRLESADRFLVLVRQGMD